MYKLISYMSYEETKNIEETFLVYVIHA